MTFLLLLFFFHQDSGIKIFLNLVLAANAILGCLLRNAAVLGLLLLFRLEYLPKKTRNNENSRV